MGPRQSVLILYLSGGIGRCFVYQEDGNVVANRIHALTLSTLQALTVLFLNERLLAGGTNQNVEQILGNHGKHSTPTGSTPRGDNEFRSIPGIDYGFYGQLEMRRIARDQA